MKKVIGTGLVLCLVASACSVSGSVLPGLSANETSATVTPKPLSDNTVKGLAYLVSKQLENGGWSEGEESAYMASVGKKNRESANVADTCMATMALVRAGNLPDRGKYAANVAKAVDFVCKSIESSDRDSLFVTDVRGIRVQQKLGQYVDTFLCAVLLPEVKGHMPKVNDNERVSAALDKVVRKIERNQDKDGGWASGGWAPIHSQSLAMQGLNKARQYGAVVSDAALAKAEGYAVGNYDRKTGAFKAGGSAGVPLYAAGATLGGLQSSIDTNSKAKDDLSRVISDHRSSPTQRADAQLKIKHFNDVEEGQKEALASVTKKLGDQGFVQGFGCNGGEEFLSYLQISQTLIANHSKDWADWDKKITSNINHVQNADGSWMGHHCITSRTFCTAAAVLVLTADRAATVPVASHSVRTKTASIAR